MANLAESLQKELKRNRELLIAYREIGPAGTFGYEAIEHKIKQAEKAMLESDLSAMICAYKALVESE